MLNTQWPCVKKLPTHHIRVNAIPSDFPQIWIQFKQLFIKYIRAIEEQADFSASKLQIQSKANNKQSISHTQPIRSVQLLTVHLKSYQFS